MDQDSEETPLIDPKEVFNSYETNSVDFEIAFSAFVATTVLSFPRPTTSYTIIKLLAISLLGLTLVRRIGVTNSFTNSDSIADLTTPAILVISYLCFLYIFEIFAKSIAGMLPGHFDHVFLMGFLVPVSYLLLFFIQEIMFQDLFIYGALISINNYAETDNPIFQEGFRKMAVQALNASFAKDAIPAELRWIHHLGEPESLSPTIWDKFGFWSGMILVSVFFVGLWTITAILFGDVFVTIAVLIAAYFVSVMVNFWYSRYGLTPIRSERPAKFDMIIFLVGFLIAAWMFI